MTLTDSDSNADTEYEEYTLRREAELEEEEKEANDHKEKRLTEEIVKGLESIKVLTNEHLEEKGLLSKEEQQQQEQSTTTTHFKQIHTQDGETTTTVKTYSDLGERFSTLTEKMKVAVSEINDQDLRSQNIPFIDHDENTSTTTTTVVVSKSGDNSDLLLDKAIAESMHLDHKQLVEQILLEKSLSQND